MHTDDHDEHSDEEFLDDVFEQAIDQLEQGRTISALNMLDGRNHLLPRVEDLVRMARAVAGGARQAAPVFAGYSVLAELGRGGMGSVYLARQDRLGGRIVALKVLPPAVSLSPRARQRFEAEARAIARLRHPNVIQVFDFLREEHAQACALEYVEGASLGQVIDHFQRRQQASRQHGGRHGERDNSAQVQPEMPEVREFLDAPAGTIPETSWSLYVCRIGIAMARALGEVHRAGLLHRDVKPSNILLRRDGTPLLSDFGLVRETDALLTQPGHFAGTLAYAPPEQLRGDTDKLDARTDIYALGATLYHALALRPPFSSNSQESLLRQIEAGRAYPLRKLNPRLPVDLQTIVAKAMEPDPQRRYDAADEMGDDLERLLGLQPIKARPASFMTRTIKLARRKRGLLAAGIVSAVLTAVLLIAVGVYVFLVPGWVADHVREARLTLLEPVMGDFVFERFVLGAKSHGPVWMNQNVSPQIRTALRHYDSALRLAPFDKGIRAERQAVQQALDAIEHPQADALPQEPLREAGLIAYLTGNIAPAMQLWTRYEVEQAGTGAPDPFVSAAMGIIYLVQEQPQRAYPRLSIAVGEFPNVGFLTTYLADASLQCGDFGSSQKLLALAEGMPRLDNVAGWERVMADWYAVTGNDGQAEKFYRNSASINPIAHMHFGRFLECRGRLREAVEQYAIPLDLPLQGESFRRSFVAAMDRWWQQESAEVRLNAISDSLNSRPRESSSFVWWLRTYDRIKSPYSPPANSAFFATLFRPFSSLDLQRVSLMELAGRMEVQNVSHWLRVVQYPNWLKKWQLRALQSPCPRAASLLIDAVFLSSQHS